MRTALKALWIRKSYRKAELKTFTSTVGCRVQRKTDIAKRDGGGGGGKRKREGGRRRKGGIERGLGCRGMGIHFLLVL